MLRYELYNIGGQVIYPWHPNYDTTQPPEKYVMYAVPLEFDGNMNNAIEIEVPQSIVEKLNA